MSTSNKKNFQTIDVKSAVLENADLLREIGKYIQDQLPIILSFKSARDALRPKFYKPGKVWIKSKKQNFVTSINMVKFAQSLNCHYTLKMLYCHAAYNGSIDVIKWVISEHPETLSSFGSAICDAAAEAGQLETLKFLRSTDPPFPWDDVTSTVASFEGNLHILEWLRSQDPPCPWDGRACSAAAFTGNLTLLKWLRAQDPPCPYDHTSCKAAVFNGHLEVLQWLRAQNPPCPMLRTLCLLVARQRNHPLVSEWIEANEVDHIESVNDFMVEVLGMLGLFVDAEVENIEINENNENGGSSEGNEDNSEGDEISFHFFHHSGNNSDDNDNDEDNENNDDDDDGDGDDDYDNVD